MLLGKLQHIKINQQDTACTQQCVTNHSKYPKNLTLYQTFYLGSKMFKECFRNTMEAQSVTLSL